MDIIILRNGANDPARPYYVFLDPNFTLGAGWIVIANHDAQKRPNTAHQARPTGNTNYIGYDQNSSSNYNDYPTTSVMVPNVSFSQDASKLVWREFVHAAYGTGPSNQDADINSDTWLTIQAYYYGSFTSDQTIGTSGTWVKTFSSSGGRVNSYSRRLQYDNSYACHSIGVMNNSSGSSPRVYGSNASTQNYPVYVGSWIGDPTNNGYQGTSLGVTKMVKKAAVTQVVGDGMTGRMDLVWVINGLLKDKVVVHIEDTHRLF